MSERLEVTIEETRLSKFPDSFTHVIVMIRGVADSFTAELIRQEFEAVKDFSAVGCVYDTTTQTGAYQFFVWK